MFSVRECGTCYYIRESPSHGLAVPVPEVSSQCQTKLSLEMVYDREYQTRSTKTQSQRSQRFTSMNMNRIT